MHFGMRKDEVTTILGSHFQESIDEFGDVNIVYPNLELEFTFWADFEFCLGYITSLRETVLLQGKKLIGSTQAQIRLFIDLHLKAKITEEDGCSHEDGLIQDWISVDQFGVTFWFYDNTLYSIDWTCKWVDSETPKWP